MTRSKALAIAILMLPSMIFAWWAGLLFGGIFFQFHADSSRFEFVLLGGAFWIVALLLGFAAQQIIQYLGNGAVVRWRADFLYFIVFPSLLGGLMRFLLQ